MGDAEGLIVGAVDRDVAAEARRATPTLADRPCLDAP
jgi:hypothetical protein